MFGDPMLQLPTYSGTGRPTDAFTVNFGSPVIGAGFAWDMGGKDFFGNPVPSSGSVNIGASNAIRQP